MRLIDADAAMDILRDRAEKYGGKHGSDFVQGCHCGVKLAIAELGSIEAEDAEPVRHGHWVKNIYPVDDEGLYHHEFFECSCCGHAEEFKHPYCVCGAKMDEEVAP